MIAPDGIVKYTSGNFNGLIISNKEINYSGWASVNLKDLEEYFESSNIPINTSCSGNDSSNNNDSKNKNNVQITFKSKIREQ